MHPPQIEREAHDRPWSRRGRPIEHLRGPHIAPNTTAIAKTPTTQADQRGEVGKLCG